MLKTSAGAGLLALALPAMVGCSSSSSANGPSPASLRVPFGPTAAKQMGQTGLGYELFIGKTLSLGLTVSRVEILRNGPSGDIVKTYEGAELTQSVAPKVSPFSADDAIFSGRDYTILYCWPLLGTTEVVPSSLYHKVYFTDGTTAEGASVSTFTGTTLIAPPIKGDRWWAANGPSNFDRHHRTAVQNLNGNSQMSQRFAVDWLQLGPVDGLVCTGDGTRNTDYYCYNADLLAVANGTVIETMDGLPDNIPRAPTILTITAQNVFGNCVVLDIGGNRYAVYAHLIPGSLRVAIGDSVSAGQVVGKLGNSGNSSGPHLHFHICNGKDAIFSEGLPFTFPSYNLLGSYSMADSDVANPWSPSAPPQTRTQEMALLDQVVKLT